MGFKIGDKYEFSLAKTVGERVPYRESNLYKLLDWGIITKMEAMKPNTLDSIKYNFSRGWVNGIPSTEGIKRSPLNATVCICASQDLFNHGCKCGYLKQPYKAQY